MEVIIICLLIYEVHNHGFKRIKKFFKNIYEMNDDKEKDYINDTLNEIENDIKNHT